MTHLTFKMMWLLLFLASVASAEGAIEKYTPDCEIPVFHWGNNPGDDSKGFVLDHIRGAIEETQTKWSPTIGNGDLAGMGLYFEADPFSSQSYGDHLLIAFVKRKQKLLDLRHLGELDDPENLDKGIAAIRSNGMLLLHRWLSKLGSADAVVVRGSLDVKEEDVPLNLKRIEVVAVREGSRSWEEHQPVEAGDSFGGALQKYSDRLLDLYSAWSAEEDTPSDESLWQVVKEDLWRKIKVGEFSRDRSGATWMPLDSCRENPDVKLNRLIGASVRKALLPSARGIRTNCDLKERLIEHYKSSKGYSNYNSIYSYLQNFKRKYRISPVVSSPGSSYVSVFSAMCEGLD